MSEEISKNMKKMVDEAFKEVDLQKAEGRGGLEAFFEKTPLVGMLEKMTEQRDAQYRKCVEQKERAETAEKALAEVTGNGEYTRECGCVLRGSWLQRSCPECQAPTMDAYLAVCNNRNSRAEQSEAKVEELEKENTDLCKQINSLIEKVDRYKIHPPIRTKVREG